MSPPVATKNCTHPYHCKELGPPPATLPWRFAGWKAERLGRASSFFDSADKNKKIHMGRTPESFSQLSNRASETNRNQFASFAVLDIQNSFRFVEDLANEDGNEAPLKRLLAKKGAGFAAVVLSPSNVHQ